MTKTKSSTESKTIHHHLALASKVTMAIAVIAFIGVLLIGVWILVTNPRVEPAVTTGTPKAPQEAVNKSATELTSDYRADLNKTLDGFAFDDSGKAQDYLNAVLELRAPSELKQVHLQVVFALQEAQTGKYTEAQERIAALKKDNAWITF